MRRMVRCAQFGSTRVRQRNELWLAAEIRRFNDGWRPLGQDPWRYPVGVREPGCQIRFRAAGSHRNGTSNEVGNQELLRRRTETLLLCRLLDWRAHGEYGSMALPGRF